MSYKKCPICGHRMIKQKDGSWICQFCFHQEPAK